MLEVCEAKRVDVGRVDVALERLRQFLGESRTLVVRGPFELRPKRLRDDLGFRLTRLHLQRLANWVGVGGGLHRFRDVSLRDLAGCEKTLDVDGIGFHDSLDGPVTNLRLLCLALIVLEAGFEVVDNVGPDPAVDVVREDLVQRVAVCHIATSELVHFVDRGGDFVRGRLAEDFDVEFLHVNLQVCSLTTCGSVVSETALVQHKDLLPCEPAEAGFALSSSRLVPSNYEGLLPEKVDDLFI